MKSAYFEAGVRNRVADGDSYLGVLGNSYQGARCRQGFACFAEGMYFYAGVINRFGMPYPPFGN